MRSRKIPIDVRRKMNASGKCRCDICNEPHILVEHHIEGRKINNYQSESNRCYICDNDHRLIHEGLIILEGWIQTSSGLILSWHYKDEQGLTGNDMVTHIIQRSHSIQCIDS